MHKSFYKLNRDPFAPDFESDFLWLGEKHKEALSALRYGILDNKGFLLLSGVAGAGKTTLITALTQDFGADLEWAIISDPKLERIDFYNAIANSFGLEKQFSSKVQFLIQFSHFLHKADDENKKVVLIIDECHLLSQEMLEELRLLSNIEKADKKLINIFFVGQPEFKNMLVLPENRAVRQRLTLKSELVVLNASETDGYIRHRLRVAGSEENIFNNKAVQLINKLSQGVAKNIDVLCHNLLIAGAALGQKSINHKDVAACVQQLKLPARPTYEDFDNVENLIFSEVSGVSGDLGTDADELADLSSFPVAQKSKRRGVTYALGALVLLSVGGYFWFTQQKIEDPSYKIAQVEHTVIEEKVVARELPSVASSPAVTVLEKSINEINEEKAAELKNAILEKAYSEVEKTKEVEPVGINEEESPEADAVPPVQENEVPASITEEVQVPDTIEAAGSSEVAEKTDIPPVSKTVTSEEVVTISTEKIKQPVDSANVETGKAVAEVEDVPKLPPLEPVLVRLPLLPNSLKLTRTGTKRLDSFIKKLQNYPRATILVKGFVSSKSNSPENIKLSENRADSVLKMMLAKGVDPEQVEVVGMGNREPIASNATRKGRATNRRVEIVVITDGT